MTARKSCRSQTEGHGWGGGAAPEDAAGASRNQLCHGGCRCISGTFLTGARLVEPFPAPTWGWGRVQSVCIDARRQQRQQLVQRGGLWCPLPPGCRHPPSTHTHTAASRSPLRHPASMASSMALLPEEFQNKPHPYRHPVHIHTLPALPTHAGRPGLEFYDPPQCPFFDYPRGAASPYGEQTLALARRCGAVGEDGTGRQLCDDAATQLADMCRHSAGPGR